MRRFSSTCRFALTLLATSFFVSESVVAFQARPFLQKSTPPVTSANHDTSFGFEVRQRPSPLRVLPSGFARIVTHNKVADTFAIFCGALFLVGYHFSLFRKEQRGERTWRSAQADVRERWSIYVRENEQWLYAIQTLRNAITAQTFLSTTVLSLLTVIGGRLWDIIRNLGEINSEKKYLVTQFTLVTLSMLTSAYHFLQSARLMTHAGFMFPVDPNKTKVDNIMRKTQNAQWLGLRFLYISVGVISWVVGGPGAFFISSLLLTLFFRKIDRVPEEIDDDFMFVI
jgi:hypothetical protein